MNDKEKKHNEKVTKFYKGILWFALIFYCFMSVATIVGTVGYSIDISNSNIEEIKENKELLDYIGELNSYSYNEIIEISSNMNDKYEIMLVELIIPSIFILLGNILLIFLMKEILNYTKYVDDENVKTIKEKYKKLKTITLFALFFVIENLILWLVIGILMETTQNLFDKYLKLETKKEN